MHPFFKQAKKPEWLAKNLIADIPPIESRRPIKKFPQKQVASSSTDEWDFNDEAHHHPHQQLPGLHPPKRHISFGHVVVRKPSSTSQHHASESWSYSSSPHFADTALPSSPPSPPPPPITGHSPPPRKGRALSDDFLIEASRIANSKHYAHVTDEPTKQHRSNSSSSRFNLSRGRARHGSLHERTPTVTFSEETSKPNGKLLYRTISHEDNMNRKSRFSPQPPPSSPPPPPHLQALPLSRNNSNMSAATAATGTLTRENSESRKIGRFELTSNSEATTSRQQSYIEASRETTSPYSTTHSSSSSSLPRGQQQKSIPAVYNQLNELLRQNDAQKQLLTELFSMFELPKSSSGVTEQQSKRQQEMVSTIVSVYAYICDTCWLLYIYTPACIGIT